MKHVLGRSGLWVGCLWLAVACVGCTGSKGDPCQVDADCDKGLVCDPPDHARSKCVNPADIQSNTSDAGVGTGGTATGGASSGSGGSDMATGGKQNNSGSDAGADAAIDAGVDASIDAGADAGGDSGV